MGFLGKMSPVKGICFIRRNNQAKIIFSGKFPLRARKFSCKLLVVKSSISCTFVNENSLFFSSEYHIVRYKLWKISRD